MKSILSFKFKMQYLFLYIAYGIFAPFFALYLSEELHFTGSQIGIIISLGFIVSLVSLPLFGMISDITRRPKTVLLSLLVFSVLLTINLGFQASFIGVLISVFVLEFFLKPVPSVQDSLTIRVLEKNKLNFNKIRVFGSLGFILGGVLLGMLLKYFDTNIIIVSYAVLLGITAIFVFTTPNIEVNESETTHFKQDLPKLLKNKNFILIMLIGGLVIGSANGAIRYISIRMIQIGAKEELIGFITVFLVILELIVMPNVNKIFSKFGTKKVLIFSIIVLSVRWAVYSYTSNVGIFLMATILHGLAIGILIPGILLYINDHVSKNLHSTAFSLYGSFLSLMTALYIYIIGLIFDYVSLQFSNVVILILTLLALIFIPKLDD